MSCRACHDLLQRRLDENAAIQEESAPFLEQHLRDCPRCDGLFRAALRFREGMQHLPLPAPPPWLTESIVAQVDADRRRRISRRRLLVVSALAASLVVALLARGFLSRPDAGGLTSPVPVPVAKKPESSPLKPQDFSLTLRDSMAEAGSAVATLTARTAGEAVGETRLLLPPMDPPSIELPPLDPPTGPLKEAGASLSAGLEPVTDSARRAVDLFRRELPPMTALDKLGL